MKKSKTILQSNRAQWLLLTVPQQLSATHSWSAVYEGKTFPINNEQRFEYWETNSMRKISPDDERVVIDVLRQWQKNVPLTWEDLRTAVASQRVVQVDQIWSRQSLSANKAIAGAFKLRKARLARASSANGRRQSINDERADALLSQANFDLEELQKKYDNLALRHRQLVYNASLLVGGANLLIDPLPDNTRSQGGESYRQGLRSVKPKGK